MVTQSKNGFLLSLNNGESKCRLCTEYIDKLNNKVLLSCCENMVCETCYNNRFNEDGDCIICSCSDIRTTNIGVVSNAFGGVNIEGNIMGVNEGIKCMNNMNTLLNPLSEASLNINENKGKLGLSELDSNIPFDLSCWLPQNLTGICTDYHSNKSTNVTSHYHKSSSNSLDGFSNINTLNNENQNSFVEKNNINDGIWDNEKWNNHPSYDSNNLLDNFNGNLNNTINGIDIYPNNSLYTWTISNQLTNDESIYSNLSDSINVNSIDVDFGKLYFDINMSYNSDFNSNVVNNKMNIGSNSNTSTSVGNDNSNTIDSNYSSLGIIPSYSDKSGDNSQNLLSQNNNINYRKISSDLLNSREIVIGGNLVNSGVYNNSNIINSVATISNNKNNNNSHNLNNNTNASNNSIDLVNNQEFHNVAFPPLTSASIKQSNLKDLNKGGGTCISPSTSPYIAAQGLNLNTNSNNNSNVNCNISNNIINVASSTNNNRHGSHKKLDKSFAEMSLNGSVVKTISVTSSPSLVNGGVGLSSVKDENYNNLSNNLKSNINLVNNTNIKSTSVFHNGSNLLNNSNHNSNSNIENNSKIAANNSQVVNSTISNGSNIISSTNSVLNVSQNTIAPNKTQISMNSSNQSSYSTYIETGYNLNDDTESKDLDQDDDSLIGANGEPYNYKRALCRHWMRGYCWLETDCKFAHGEVELRTRDGKLRHSSVNEQKMVNISNNNINLTKNNRQKSNSTSCNSSIDYNISSTPEVVDNK